MPSLATLPLLGGLSVLAVAGGVAIGSATIDQINPIYYQAPSGHFYGDMVANRPSGKAPAEAEDDYVQADYAYSATPYCTGCASAAADYQPQPVDAIDPPRHKKWRDAYVETVLVEDQVVDPPPPNRQWVERYTDYTVAADPPAPTEAAAPAEESSPVQSES